jgi:hypothetical protein
MYTANKNKPRWDGTSSDSKQVATEKRLKEFILCYSLSIKEAFPKQGRFI